MDDASLRADASGDDETVDLSGQPAGDDPFDRLAEEFATRCRRGESPSIDEFEARHPEHASRIRALLPTVAMMEQLKRRSHASKGREAARPAPERLGEFRILRELGRGGMGVVYEAVQEPLGRHVALKVIHQVHADPRRLLRFGREARAVAQLHHTNIVPIFSVGEHEGLPFYAMQYIRGEGLDVILGRWREDESAMHDEGRWRFAAGVGQQAAEAIQHAHDQGVLHRDIKPANLLIDEDGAVWVTDFGLAKLAGHDDLTASGDVIGTLRYLAPEALQGESGPRSDVYSLGLTLYEMLTLHPPFGDLNPSELLDKVGTGTLARPRSFDPAIPRDLETVALKAIAREPEHRYATAGALADDLRRFLEDRPVVARRATVVERAWRWSRRNRALAVLMAATAGALLLAAVVGWFGFVREADRRREADEAADSALAFLGELVDRFSAKEEASRQDPGPPPHEGEGPPPDGPGLPPDDFGRRPPPPFGEPRGPGAAVDSEMLRSVVRFYDLLARKNGTAPERQGEAAWALFKIGGHDERHGNAAEADQECDRALGIFEDLAAGSGADARYFARLTKFPDMVTPEVGDKASLGRTERRLRRLGSLLDRLADAWPDDPGLARARMRARMKLGAALRRSGRPDEAELESQAAVELAEELLGLDPEDKAARIDLLDARFALARLQMGQQHRNLAWVSLQEAATELRSPASRPATSTVIADQLEAFASEFHGLGQTDRSTELMRWSDVVDPRGPGGPFGPDGGPREGGPGPEGRFGPGPKPRPGP